MEASDGRSSPSAAGTVTGVSEGSVAVLVDGLRLTAVRPGGRPVVLDAVTGRDPAATAGALTRHLVERLGVDVADHPWTVGVGSQVGSAVRDRWRRAVRGAGVGTVRLVDLGVAVAWAVARDAERSTATSSGSPSPGDEVPRNEVPGDAEAGRSGWPGPAGSRRGGPSAPRPGAPSGPTVGAWWGRDGVDVAVVRAGRTLAQGGGGLGTDVLLAAVAAPEVDGPDRVAAGAWTVGRARSTQPSGWADVVRRWAPDLDRAEDLVDEVLDVLGETGLAADGTVGSVRWRWAVAGEPGPVDALADRLAARGRRAVAGEAAGPGEAGPSGGRAGRSGAAPPAVVEPATLLAVLAAIGDGEIEVRALAGLDVGVESLAGGPHVEVVVARGTPLPARRTVELRPRVPADLHRVPLIECWGPDLAAGRTVTDLVVPTVPAGRWRLTVEVDADGVVAGRLRAVPGT